MNIYTSGMLKTYTECPAKYNLMYNEHIQIPYDNTNSEIGNKIHALINYYYKGFDISRMTNFKDDENASLLKELWNNFLEIKPKNILKSEYVFNAKLMENTILTGRVDGIFKNGKNIIIADWKTGSENLDIENNAQTEVYLYSIYVLLKEVRVIDKFENLSIIYYFLKNKTQKQIILSAEFFEKTKKNIISLTKRINADNEYLKGNMVNCESCLYKNVCSCSYEAV